MTKETKKYLMISLGVVGGVGLVYVVAKSFASKPPTTLTPGKIPVQSASNIPLNTSNNSASNNELVTYVKKLQTNLNYLGYKAGSVDGVYGSQTESALKAFASAKGLLSNFGTWNIKRWAEETGNYYKSSYTTQQYNQGGYYDSNGQWNVIAKDVEDIYNGIFDF